MKKSLGAVVGVLLGVISGRADTTLVFNEIMYHPSVAGTNEAKHEWLELYNQFGVDLDVSGWRIKGDVDFTFPNNTRVPGRSFIVIAADSAQLIADNPMARNIVGQFTNRLSNSGGTLQLYNNADRLMDQVDYETDGDWPVAPDGGGVSLAKRDRDFGSSKASNWAPSQQFGGTPGYDNFALAANVSLVPIDTGWRFEASGTDLGTAWRGASFDDTAWSARHNLTNRSIPSLFNTGVGANGLVQANNIADPHYTLTAAAQGTVGAQATNIANNAAWLANNSVSSWIGVGDGAGNVAFGNYNYRTGFTLDGFIPSTVQVNLIVAIDNNLNDVLLNGVSQGFNYGAFNAFSSAFALTNLNAGTNTVEFLTVNAGTSANPHGFRAQFTSSGLGLNTNAPIAAGQSTYYFRTRFVFSGEPSRAELTINPIVTDGAVFYLNGVEVYRYNMPAGAISASTPAVSNITTIGYAGAVTISPGALIKGTNVLAVEVHQASGSPDGPLLGADLRFSELPASASPIAINEISGTTNAPFWVEIINYGTNAVKLDDLSIIHEASGTNDVFIKPAGYLQPGQRLSVTNTIYGLPFASGDKLLLEDAVSLVDAAVLKKGPRARSPEAPASPSGTGYGPAPLGDWYVPASPTPGAANNVVTRNELVINELMYHHSSTAISNGLPVDNPEQWIEIYNRSSNTVDLTGWELDDAVEYTFPTGKTIAPGAYLVVARDSSALRALYPTIDIVGDFKGKLSGSDERVTLKDPLGNPANTFHYYTDGRWPEYPDGDGSSLELRDPLADNSAAEAWAASDESAKTSWQTYTYTMVAAPSVTAAPDTQWREFVLGMLAGGECLIDDISVVQGPGGANIQFIDNGNFENGVTGWRVLGNHRQSRVESEPGNPGNHVLHVFASGPQEHMHNHIETTLASGRSVTNGQTYQISYRAKWIGGGNLLNTRLYFNRCARTMALPRPALTGTPGARNSVYATNIGPTFANLGHNDVVPTFDEPVSVSANVKDPQGVAACDLFWSVNGGAWASAAMTITNGRCTGTIPPQAAGALVQFYIRGTDTLGAISTFPAAGSNSAAFYRVNDGLANLALQHNLRVLMSPANTALLHASTNVMSNETLPCTVIYDERFYYYDARVRLKSSERGRDNAARVGFHIEFPPHQLFRDVHPVLLLDRSAGGSRPAQEEIVLKHMAQRAGLHIVNSDVYRILAPQAAQNGPAIVAPRYEDEFLDASFNNGSDGTLWELELIYYPTTANAAGYKLPQPDAVQGLDVQDNGNDKEAYRYNFIIKNHRGDDNYAPFMQFAKIWSNTNLALLDAQTHMTMDINEWLRTYALVSLCGVSDMYTFGNNHNFMFYLRPSDGQMLYLPWDMDFSFSQGTTAALVGNSPANNLYRIINLTPNLRRLYAHMLDQIATVYNTSYMSYWVGHYGPFSSQDYTGDLSYIQQRGDFAKNTINAAGGNAPFAVTGTNFITTSNNLIVLSGTAPVSVTSLLVNSNEYPIVWNTLSTWTMTIPVSEASNVLTIAGYGLNGNLISNVSRIVVYTNAIPSPVGNVMFSEIMFNPTVPGAEYIELFNASSNFVFDLSGWRINGLDYTFPNGTILSNRQFLTICANEPIYLATYGTAAGVPVNEFHGTLQLDGETLTLVKPGATPAQDLVVDKVRYDGAAPWPSGGPGSSLQLVDFTQDNARVANWGGSFSPSKTNDGWRFVSTTATFGTNPRLLLFPDAAGTVLLDDISLVVGTVPEVGVNYVKNGDFESPLGAEWQIPTNMTDSTIISDNVHSGAGALQMVASVGGTASTLSRDLVQLMSPAPASGAQVTLSFWFWATNNSVTNIAARIPGTSINVVTNIAIFITSATNIVTPNAPNFGAASLPTFQPLWINEVQPDNVSGQFDNFGQRDPWIEIYNASTNPVSLDGLFLSTNYADLTNYAFPAGITLAPGEFKVIWCDGEAGQTTGSSLHTSFRLPSTSGSIALTRLYNGQPQVLDYVNYAGVHPDRSFGSYPDGQPFQRYELFYVTPGTTNNGASAPLTVFINEWMASNTNSLADPADGQFEDWFELYNPSTNAVDLAGYYLTDSLTNAAGVVTNKFQFRITTNMAHIIPPLGYLLVWADNEASQNVTGSGNIRPDLHVNFALSKGGEAIGLFAEDGTKIDYVTFGAQSDDVSRGRYPDGSPTIMNFPGTTSPRAANFVNGGANSAPVLSAIGNRFVYLGNTLSFTATAIDAEAPPQTLTFTLDPGAPPSANITTGGLFTWTPGAVGSYPVTVRVTDNGAPALNDTENIIIDVLPAPRFSTALRSDSTFELSWPTRSGQTYRVEYKNDLNDAQWQLLQSLTATGNTLSITNSTVTPQKRFYRIVIQ